MQTIHTKSSYPGSKPLILAVETSGRLGSVALAVGSKILGKTAFSTPVRHSAEIFPAITSLLKGFGLKPHQIEHIYISVGPGSFTGLRIAATIAKIMNLANGTKIVTVDTLDVIAANAEDFIINNGGGRNIEKIATILDAKRGQFFIAVYSRPSQTKIPSANTEHRDCEDRSWQKICPDSLMTPAQLLERFANENHPVWLLGEGLVYYKDKFKSDSVRFFEEKYWHPTAEKVHLLGFQKALAGQFAEPLTLQPAYLRCPEIGTKRKPGHI